ncbi:hypothetical protein [Thermoflexus sp.]|uniref:hypothetical protein n=1 Tax=Thermoflexus sp. TaxID=1969742 RepID=UPI002ADE01C3|nr:hypothetical protein [Thermoflexus sp.]
MGGRHPIGLADSGILLALAGWIALLYWPFWSGDPRMQAAFRPGDLTEHHYPFAAYAHRRLQTGQLPLWDPYTLGGHPFAADIQAQAFYPVRWLTALLALGSPLGIRGYVAETIAHLILTAWGAYGFFRRISGDRAAAAFGAFAWSLSGYLTGYPLQDPPIIASATWLPWLLWALAGLFSRSPHPNRWRMLGIFAWAMAFLGGHTQTAFYVYAIALAFSGAQILRVPSARGQGLRELLHVLVLGTGWAAAPLLATAELIPWIERTSWTFPQRAGGFELWELWGMFWPQLTLWSPLYVGIPTVVLATYGLTSGLGKNASISLWGGLAGLGLLLTLGGEAALYPAFVRGFPFLEFFRNQERAALIVAWSLIALAVLNWPPSPGESFQRTLGLLTGIIGLLLMGILIGIQAQDSTQWPRLHRLFSQAMWPWGALVGTWLLLRAWPRTRWALVALLALDVGSVAWRTAEAGHRVWQNPERIAAPPLDPASLPAAWPPYRVDTRGLASGNWPAQVGIEDLHGSVTLSLRALERFRREVPGERVWALMGVGCYLQRPDEPPLPFPSQHLQTISFHESTFELYCLEKPFSRFHMIYEAMVLDDETAIRALRDAAFDPLRTVILDRPWSMPGLSVPSVPPRITLQGWAPEMLRLDVWTERPGFLVIGDVWYPGWRAWIDGRPAPVLRAYTTLRAIPIPAGAHQVVLRYEPLSVRAGLVLSGIAILITLAGLGPRRLLRPSRPRGLGSLR